MRELQRIDGDDYAGRAKLFTVIALARASTNPQSAPEAARSAMFNAQRAGDESVRAWALIAHCAADLSCEQTPARAAMALDALKIAQSTGETDIVGVAFFIAVGSLMELGEIPRVDRMLGASSALLTSFPFLQNCRQLIWFRCMRATMDGDLERAEQLAYQGYAVARRESDPDAKATWLAQLSILRWLEGRVVEFEPMFLQARQDAPDEPALAVALAWIWLRQGRRSAARALMESLPPIERLPVNRAWLETLSMLATVAAELRDVDLCSRLCVAFEPFADRVVTLGMGVSCWGTVARQLGLLSDVLGEREVAVQHYREAVRISARIGAHAALTEAQIELAALLVRSADSGDRREALDIATEAVTTARARQLRGLEDSATKVLKRATARSSALIDTEAYVADAGGPSIRVMGGFEVRSASGELSHWQSRKARQLLKILVARRGVAVGKETVMHLLWPDQCPDRLANRFYVATNAVRRALDPHGEFPRDEYLETRSGLVRLCVEKLEIDVERFVSAARAAVLPEVSTEEKVARLTDALALYTSDPLADEQEELWAEELRREVRLAFFSAAHMLADACAETGDHLTRVDTYRRIIQYDQYDQRAHEGLIDALETLRSYGQAASARREYARVMEELGMPLTT